MKGGGGGGGDNDDYNGEYHFHHTSYFSSSWIYTNAVEDMTRRLEKAREQYQRVRRSV